MNPTISTCIALCAFAFCGCASNSTTRSVEAQTAILDSGALVCPEGAEVVPTGAGVTYRFTGRVYVLPEAAYRALMLTE